MIYAELFAAVQSTERLGTVGFIWFSYEKIILDYIYCMVILHNQTQSRQGVFFYQRTLSVVDTVVEN